jgi:hypothetical protein
MSIGSERLLALSSEEASRLQKKVWNQVAIQIDGIALGTTITALHERGILEEIALHPGIRVGKIVTRTNCRRGYLHVMLKLMSLQGWLLRGGAVGDDMELRLTPQASDLPRHALFYKHSHAGLRTAHWLASGKELPPANPTSEIEEVLEKAAQGWGMPAAVCERESAFLSRVSVHLDGFVAAGYLALLERLGLLPTNADIHRPLPINLPDRENAEDAIRLTRFLCRIGWAQSRNGLFDWMAEGVMAALMQRQYWYPLTYLATLSRVGELLGGELTNLDIQDDRGDELHLDRNLDIRFSGEVFNQTCREPFFALVLPIFNQPLAEQPTYLVDVGCGNGNLLAATWQAIVEQTARGNQLSERPLIAVGLDVNRIARESAGSLLTSLRIPNIMVPGDIGQPGAIKNMLQQYGISCADSLFLTKSVIHNRRFRKPRFPINSTEDDGGLIFVADDGELLSAAEIEQSLVELLSEWRPLITKHGWVIIEAHSVSAEIGAANLGRSQITILDATHGFSNQFLLNPQRFRRAASRAGLRSTAGSEMGEAEIGHVVLTFDRFEVETGWNLGSFPDAACLGVDNS